MSKVAQGAAGVVSFLTGPWGLAIAGAGLALGGLISWSNQATDALSNDLANAFTKVADGADGASAKVSSLMGDVAKTANSTPLLGAQTRGLNGALSYYRNLPRWLNWANSGTGGALDFLNFDGKQMSSAAQNIGDAFERIGEIARSGNVAGAAEALRQMRVELIKGGASNQAWDKTLDSALDSVTGLRAGLEEYAKSMGYATDKQSLHNLLTGQTSLLWQKMQADQARLAYNTVAFGKAMDQNFAQWGFGAKKAEGLHAAIERVSQSMIDVGAAARDANGEAVQSVETVLSNLQAQVDAQAQVAQNMLDLASAGFSSQVLEQLAQLPQGAQYLQQLKDALADTSDAGRAHLQELLDQVNGLGPALQGAAWNSTPALQEFHNAVTGSFDAMKQNVVASLDQLGADAGVRAAAAGATTTDELIKALSAAGVQISQTADGWALTLDGKTAQFGAAGTNNANAYVNAIGATAPSAYIVGTQVGNQAHSGLSTPNYAQPGSAGGSRFAAAVSSYGSAAYAAGSHLASQVVSAVSGLAGRLWSMGVNAGASFANAIMSRVSGAVAAAQSMADSVVSGVKVALSINSPSKVFRKIGYSVPEGFAQGIERATGWATSAAVGMASETVGAARGVLEINSPSKVFRRFGEFIPQGLAGGIRSEADAAVREAEAMAGRVVDAGTGVRMRVFDGGRLDMSQDSRVTVRVDPESLRGARFGLRLSDETELETFISDVADGRVVEYARMGA